MMFTLVFGGSAASDCGLHAPNAAGLHECTAMAAAAGKLMHKVDTSDHLAYAHSEGLIKQPVCYFRPVRLPAPLLVTA